MARIEFECPHCGRHLGGSDSLCGQTLTCPSCKGIIIIPNKESDRPEAKIASITLIEDRYDQSKTPGVLPNAAQEPGPERELFRIRPSIWAASGEIFLGLLLAVAGVGLLLLLHAVIRKYSLQYVLSTQRLFIRRGLIARHIEEVELYRIKDVTVHQSIFQRLIGIGTITMLSSDDSNPKIMLKGVHEPEQIKDIIRNQFRAARSREKMGATEFVAS